CDEPELHWTFAPAELLFAAQPQPVDKFVSLFVTQCCDGSDPGHRYGPEHVVRAARDGGLRHRRLAEQDLLHLCGIHHLAAAVDDVVAAPGEEEVPVDVESSEVAGVQPACGVEPLGGHSVGVGADHALTTDADPPDDVRGAPPALRIDHLQFHPHRPAG